MIVLNYKKVYTGWLRYYANQRSYNRIDFIKTNREHISFNYRISKIGLIGSYARGEQREESDIDLLVEFEPGTEDLFELKSELKQYFKKYFNRNIDVCREKYIKSYVKEHILKEAVYA